MIFPDVQISVVIPVYNRPYFLGNVVNSILSQTVPVSEIILVDDGSTDDVAGAVQRRMEASPEWRKRVRFLRQENQGQSAAYNHGIQEARGNWLAFLNDDDLWLPHKIELQLRALEKFGEPYGLCFTDGWFMNHPTRKMTLFQFAGRQYPGPVGAIDEPVRVVVAGQHGIWMQSVLMRADVAREAGGLDSKLRYSEDNEFFFRLARLTRFCYVSIPMVLIDRSPDELRHDGASRIWHKEEFRLGTEQYRFEKQLQLSEGLPDDVIRNIRKNLWTVHSAWTNLYIEEGEYGKARASISMALNYGFTPTLAIKWILTRLSPALFLKIISLRKPQNTRRQQALDSGERLR